MTDPHLLAKIRTCREPAELAAMREALREENPEANRDGDVMRAFYVRELDLNRRQP